jgi:hypothetical protein
LVAVSDDEGFFALGFALQQTLAAPQRHPGITKYRGIGLAGPALITIRSPGPGRKAILSVTAKEKDASGDIRAIK